MTSEQRDFVRRQIDAQMRERVERARSAKAHAKMEALERQRLEEAVVSLPDDVDVEGVTLCDERLGEEDRRREALRQAQEVRIMARRRLQKVCDEGLQTLKPGSRPQAT